MKTVSELKDEKEIKVSESLKNNSVFFAFSNEQFQQNKTPLNEGEKYCSIGAGGYAPKSKVNSFIADMEAVNKWFNDAIIENKQRENYIAYELANHEAYYTYSIEDTLEALGKDYSEEEVMKVFYSEIKKEENVLY